MKNWKTTLGGVLSAVGYALSNSPEPVSHTVGVCITAIGLLITGYHAADKFKVQ
jgi:hypothetical protein